MLPTVPDDPELTPADHARDRPPRRRRAQGSRPRWDALQHGSSSAASGVSSTSTASCSRSPSCPAVAVRLRRTSRSIRSLVFAHAILHQATPRPATSRAASSRRSTTTTTVRALIADIVAEGIGATVSRTTCARPSPRSRPSSPPPHPTTTGRRAHDRGRPRSRRTRHPTPAGGSSRRLASSRTRIPAGQDRALRPRRPDPERRRGSPHSRATRTRDARPGQPGQPGNRVAGRWPPSDLRRGGACPR